MNKTKICNAVKGFLNGAIGQCEKAVKSPRFGMVLAMLCMVSVTFAQNAAGDYSQVCSRGREAVLRHCRCRRCCWCYLGLYQDEQRGAGCQEEHHDARGCLHLPDCSCPGSASVLRYRRRVNLIASD